MFFRQIVHKFPRSSHSLLPLMAATVLFGGALPPGCGSDPKVDSGDTSGNGDECVRDEDCGVNRFCGSGTCQDVCDTCGLVCTQTDECPVGQFCSAGACQKECVQGDAAACGKGRTCNQDGKCVAESSIEVTSTSDGGGAGGGNGGEDCIEVEVDFEPEVPNVVLLIDQSGSMNHDDGIDNAIENGSYTPWNCPDTANGNTSGRWDNDDNEEADDSWRWNTVRNILLNPDSGIVKPLEDKVRFGLTTYSSEGGFGNDEMNPKTCPMLTEVDIAFGNHQAMLDSFQCSDLVGDTPTRESLTAAAEKLAAAAYDGPKVIVLATDGAPDTCSCQNWNAQAGAACVDTATVEYMGMDYTPEQYEQILVALEAARIHDELGITVEVINVGEAGLKPHLDSVAAAGGALSGASIDGTGPAALTDAFNTIIDGVRSCVIDLDGEIAKGKEDSGTVALDGEELVFDGPDGWVVLNPSQIELVGAACEAIKSGDHDLDVTFPCDSFDIVR